MRTALAIGGVSMGGQVRSLLNGVDVLVATPGRLLDLVKGNALRFDSVECFVLDEADRMLDMGFIHDIRKIVAKLPKERQTLMFSATMPRAIRRARSANAARPGQGRGHARCCNGRSCRTARHPCRSRGKAADPDRCARATSRSTASSSSPAPSMAPTRSCAGWSRPASRPRRSTATSRKASASARCRAFRDGKVKTLVATDIAARGIDVDGVSHVVNFDLPNVPESYVHRIGRTARAGAEGIAISLCDGEEMAFLRDIEKLIRISIPVTDKRSHPGRDEPKDGKQVGKISSGRSHASGNRGSGSHGSGSRGSSHRGSSNRGPGKDGANKDRHWQSRDKARKQPRHGQASHGQTSHGHSNDHSNHGQPREIASVAFLNAGAPSDR